MGVHGRASPISAAVWVLWASANAVGIAVVALPDTGPRIFSFSEAHGPSILDAVGSLLVIAGWACLETAIWRRRRRLHELPWQLRVLAGGLVVAGIAILIPTIAFDLGAWWVLGVGVLVTVQLAAAVAVSRRRSS